MKLLTKGKFFLKADRKPVNLRSEFCLIFFFQFKEA
nr:MAG TPA: hypothetical protein [Inoviridae sp.]